MVDKCSPTFEPKKPYFVSRMKRWKRGKRKKQKRKKMGKASKERFLRHTFHFSSRTRELFIQNLSKSHPLFLPHVLLSLSLFPSFFFFLNRIQQKGTGCLAYVTYENARHSAGKTPSSSRMRGCSVYHSILRSSDVPSDLQTARK